MGIIGAMIARHNKKQHEKKIETVREWLKYRKETLNLSLFLQTWAKYFLDR